MKSPAKINLGLNILRKRDDGFHDIESIMYQLGLTDTLIFEKTDTFSFSTENLELSSDISNNLIVRAVRKLEEITGKHLDIKITLEKNIPMGAGLGGGSSNAAITLTALNELFGLDLTDAVLLRLAGHLGSDVPFFIKPAPAYATSRGEVLKRFAFELPYSIVLVNPGIHVSTPWAYKNVTPSMPETPLREWIEKGTFNAEELLGYLKNDFEIPVFTAFPEIKTIKEKLLQSGAIFALMSGSGSSVFALFDDPQKAEDAFTKFNKNYFTYIEVPE